jgi:quinol monooxygenase YgiN
MDRVRSRPRLNTGPAQTKIAAMTTKGLIVTLHAREGKEAEVAEFLSSATPLVQAEEGTTAWFALRLDTSTFAIVDVFPDDAARDAHLSGQVAAALFARAEELFAEQPAVQQVDVLADKLPGHDVEDREPGWQASEWASTGRGDEHPHEHEAGWQASEWTSKDLPGDRPAPQSGS